MKLIEADGFRLALAFLVGVSLGAAFMFAVAVGVRL